MPTRLNGQEGVRPAGRVPVGHRDLTQHKALVDLVNGHRCGQHRFGTGPLRLPARHPNQSS